MRAQACDGGNCGASGLWCQEERLQDIVVRLRRSGDRQIPTADLGNTRQVNQTADAERWGNREHGSYVLEVSDSGAARLIRA